jgi:uncharacterized C2H2 Zn-finger protein
MSSPNHNQGDIMKCPYCGKLTRDMVDHLHKNNACSEKHRASLKKTIREIFKRREMDDLIGQDRD